MVHAFKFLGRKRAAGSAAGWMALRSPAFPELGVIDAVVPVPLHPHRQRERGYNQARILAEAVGQINGRPVLELLVRHKPTAPQWRLSRVQRGKNLRGAFSGLPAAAGMNILLVDDVCTTGATLEEGALALRRAGAARVCGYVFARD